MRNLKYGVVALTPLLGAGGFAQGLNLGMNDGVILEAQAPAQTGPYDAMNGGGKPAQAKTHARKGEKKTKDTRTD